MPNHNHVMIAHRIGQLDHMARGRLYRVGWSSTPGDYEMFGFDPDSIDRRKYTRQSLDLILKIWEDPKPGLHESEQRRFKIQEPVDRSVLRSTSPLTLHSSRFVPRSHCGLLRQDRGRTIPETRRGRPAGSVVVANSAGGGS